MDIDNITGGPHNYLFLTLDRFSQRNLSNEDDAIDAMSGILQRVANRANTVSRRQLSTIDHGRAHLGFGLRADWALRIDRQRSTVYL